MRRARLLAAAGICALLLLLVILVTGGFTLRAGPLHLTAHNWRTPLLVLVAAAIALAWLDRPVAGQALAAVWQFAGDHAAALAVVIAASTAATGLIFNTFSASSSDASGYVSESRLLGSWRLADDEPLARAVGWPDATWAFTPLGYRPGADLGELVPTYPAGLPLVIAPVQRVAGELAAYLVVPGLGAIAVLATFWLGVRLHSRQAGLVSAALLATSPIVLFQLVQPMSDVPVTAWWALAVLLALSPWPRTNFAAGVVTGLAILTRPNLAPFAAVVFAALVWRRDQRDRAALTPRIAAWSAGVVPAALLLALVQWRLYGNPLLSGYGSAGELFAVANIAPNLVGYAQRLLRGEGPALGLGALALAVLALGRAGGARPLTSSIARPLALTTMALAIVAASYLPYAVFTEWSYLRFLLPAFPLLYVLVGALLVNALGRLPSPARGPMLAAVLVLACSVNIVRAREEQAFDLQRYESRYRLAGLYLRETLPRDAVIVTVQESGSARYYVGLPILRWDRIRLDLDTALATLQALGRHPVLLIEDWERAELRQKFPASTNARLDWSPRAEFGDETRVHLFDPADRGQSPGHPADRVH